MGRIYLNTGDKIKLVRSLDSQEFEEFEIQSLIGVGAAAVCYSATLGEKSGRLKEFYPLNDGANSSVNFERNETNQLVVSEFFVENFKKMCADYLSSFKILDEARIQTGGLLLNNFVPVQQIYFGYTDSGTASVYIWSPDDKHGLLFSEYVKDVRKNFEHQPVKKFFNVLRTLLTLADCVKVFHSLGIVHCDLKPSNFLVTYDSEGEINPANISLFDLNSIYNLDSEYPCPTKGTSGFSAPELEQGRISNRSDLYSLGCILFNAVIIAKEAESAYRADYFEILPQLINNSELLNASPVNSNLQIESLLSRILKKCLAHNPLERYKNCEELIVDLKQLILLLVPGLNVDALKDLHKKIIIVDDENFGMSDPTIILQDLLYKTPLFDFQDNSETLNIITIGAGTFAQKFIDQALQAAQVPFIADNKNICERKVSIKAFSNNPEYDKELYYSKRPALTEFINLNGSLNNFEKDIYGQLDFLEVPQINPAAKGFSISDMEVNIEIIDQIISDAKSNIDYVFIALGDDDLNKKIAAAFVDATQALEMNTKINYVIHDNIEQAEFVSNANPVFISKKITPETISAALEQRAWNCHLSWLGTLSTDLREERKNYLQRYNHESSLSFALSIRYKLASLGIDDEKPDAAEKFAKKIFDEDLLKIFAYYEHRRWVVEKVCTGWQAQKNFTDCLNSIRQNGKPQDLKKFLHHCILRSGKELPLSDSPEKWNDSKDLDDLDKMSVELNQFLRAAAQNFKRSDPLNNGDLKIIRDEISGYDKDIQLAYKKFEFYLKLILAGNKNHSKNFKAYFKEFAAAIENLPSYTKTRVQEKLENLRKDFAVVSAGNLYIDYKLNDIILVENIPFIMTFQTPKIAMAFDDGRLHSGKNLEIFRNVAASAVLNPSQITFLYCFDENAPRVAFMYEKFASVISFLKERKIWAKIYFCIAVISRNSKEAQNSFVQRIHEHFDKLSNVTLQIQLYDNYQSVVDYFFQNLKDNNSNLYDGSTDLFHSNYWNAIFTKKIVDNFPYFEFDAVKKKFTVTQNCDHLNLISDNSFIYVRDLFSLRQVQVNTYNNFVNYVGGFFDELWTIYSNQTGNKIDEGNYFQSVEDFSRLTRTLQDYERNIDNFLHFKFPLNITDEEMQQFKYTLTDYSKVSVEKILKILVDCNLIEEDFSIEPGGDTIEIKLTAKNSIAASLNEIFGKLNNVPDSDFINFKKSVEAVTVIFRNLHVENLKLKNQRYLSILLRKLAQKKLLVNFENKNDIVSFDYASKSIKKLLTTSGLILEVHIYTEAVKLGYFNDIMPNFDFSWKDNSFVKNEIDCILISGFKSIFLEAKAGRAENLQQENFQKFNSIVEDFGLASLKVFVCNAELNESQLERAEKMGITVVNKVADILNIGNTLKKIMEGRFQKN